MMDSKLIVGMMSGTSADGIDATLVKFRSPTDFELLATQFTAFRASTRLEINQIAHARTIENCHQSNLHELLAQHYAASALQLIESSGLQPRDVDAIANHGQTVRHEPDAIPPYSLQLGNPQNIADLTGIKTIAQFRQADLSAGGQGAPLMPAFHKAVFSGVKNRFLLNIGGIANVTQLSDTVVGFDTGPGNTLMDQWIHQCQGKPFDQNGEWAATGEIISELLERLLLDNYFSRSFPKSTGPDYFNLEWLGNVKQYREQDVQATLLELTAKSIANQIKKLAITSGEVFVCGGGAHNQTLLVALSQSLPNHSVTITDEIGVPADWMEAIGFAWLGYCKLMSIPSNLPSVTGATKNTELGEIFTPSPS